MGTREAICRRFQAVGAAPRGGAVAEARFCYWTVLTNLRASPDLASNSAVDINVDIDRNRLQRHSEILSGSLSVERFKTSTGLVDPDEKAAGAVAKVKVAALESL